MIERKERGDEKKHREHIRILEGTRHAGADNISKHGVGPVVLCAGEIILIDSVHRNGRG